MSERGADVEGRLGAPSDTGTTGADERAVQSPAPSRRELFGSGFRWRLAGGALLAMLIGFVAWFFGLDAEHAAGLGAIVLAGAACAIMLGEQAVVDWPSDPVVPRDGARREVSQLGWALHARGGGVAPEAVRRLRAVTAQTLELHGLDLDTPADAAEITRLLGQDTLRLLRRGTAESPKPARFEAIIARLSQLADAPVGRLVPDTLGDAPPYATTTPGGAAASTAPASAPASGRAEPTASTPPEEQHP